MENTEKINLESTAQFQKVFEAHYISLCLFAEKYVVDSNLAADIVQDSFLSLWEHRKEFFYIYQIKSFLYITIKNKALNEIKHQKVVDSYYAKIIEKSKDWFFRDNVIEQETYRILCSAIEKLPRRAKQVMKLTLKGYTNKEMAEEIHVSSETIHSVKKSAYKKLRGLISKDAIILITFFNFFHF